MSSLRILSTVLLLATLASVGCDRAPSKTATAATKLPKNSSSATASGSVPVNSAPTHHANDSASGKTATTSIQETTFDDLKFEMEKTERFRRKMIPPSIEALLDRPIRIRGYISPTAKRRGLKQFVLVRDNLECCFGPGAALYDCIWVHMEPGHTAEYSLRPVAVAGTLRLEEVIGPDGQPLVIYQMESREVR